MLTKIQLFTHVCEHELYLHGCVHVHTIWHISTTDILNKTIYIAESNVNKHDKNQSFNKTNQYTLLVSLLL